jgi:hypothetical protein
MKPRYIAHTGKKQPVADDVVVEVKFRSGRIDDDLDAGDMFWEHDGSFCDIIAYRVIENE